MRGWSRVATSLRSPLRGRCHQHFAAILPTPRLPEVPGGPAMPQLGVEPHRRHLRGRQAARESSFSASSFIQPMESIAATRTSADSCRAACFNPGSLRVARESARRHGSVAGRPAARSFPPKHQLQRRLDHQFLPPPSRIASTPVRLGSRRPSMNASMAGNASGPRLASS